ncbi:HAD family hydrolase [Geosporobacter ferrireducens]|uniref:Haloacid dehalogenase n=1 Tax=Geosporobacter ferrireducens TaxID=1424294 RepID=A0A1D8GMM2_9FIRM|nr:HAD hydrolase-like protein [Geosporobacter ferrireducens]AOT72191.1 hypothetical protein Gferi_23190 [Geosporobacter ferrireducens]
MRNILLVWDIDGTLIHSKGCGRRAMEQTFYKLFGIKNAFQQIQMSGRLDAWIVRDALIMHNIQEKNLAVFFDAYCELLQLEMKDAEASVPIQGIQELLQYIKDLSNIYHALGTGNIERGARIKLAPQDLNRYFPVGGYGDAALERWQIIEQAVKRSNEHYKVIFQPEDIYVIGDTPLDIGCGKTLGVKTIAVATGSHGLEELRKHEPDHLFANLENYHEFFRIFTDKEYL